MKPNGKFDQDEEIRKKFFKWLESPEGAEHREWLARKKRAEQRAQSVERAIKRLRPWFLTLTIFVSLLWVITIISSDPNHAGLKILLFVLVGVYTVSGHFTGAYKGYRHYRYGKATQGMLIVFMYGLWLFVAIDSLQPLGPLQTGGHRASRLPLEQAQAKLSVPRAELVQLPSAQEQSGADPFVFPPGYLGPRDHEPDSPITEMIGGHKYQWVESDNPALGWHWSRVGR